MVNYNSYLHGIIADNYRDYIYIIIIVVLIHYLYINNRYIDGGPLAGEPDMSSTLWRRYSEFDLLRNYLVAMYPAVSIQKMNSQTKNSQKMTKCKRIKMKI